MLISICIANYKRTEELRRLLEALHQLKFLVIEAPQIEILVVENDSEALSRSFCLSLNDHSPFCIRHIVEPKPGLSYVRNTAIESINPQSDFLVFIDDDEVPEPQWLEELVITQEKYSADVVTGPVYPIFHDSLPRWLKEANIFPVTSFSTGTESSIAFTGNVMICSELLQNPTNRFDRRFALSGGEDTHFFMGIHQRGHKIIWCNEATVHEYMPQERMNFKWFWMRNYRSYSSHVICEREFEAWYKVFPRRIMTGSIRITAGLLCFLIGLPIAIFSQKFMTRSMFQIARGAGTLSGLMGIQYQEYARIDSIRIDSI